MTASQTDATNDPQTVIAALQQKLDEGLAREAALAEELAARDATFALHKTEFDERIEYQAATLDILTTMSGSPGDAQPVLDLIVRHATELCNVPSATLFEYDGELVHIRSDYRSETILAPSALATYIQLFPMHPARGSISCRAILDRQIIHIRDLRLDPELADFARELGHRSQVSVPLIRDDLAIGVITIGAQAAGGFSDRQVELLKTFAKQAVIAITSAETYRALQERTVALAQRNTEYGERIEHQSATIDVLKAMSASPGDPQPVFDLIVDRARDLCDAYGATVFEFDGTEIHWRAATGVSDDPAVRVAYEAQFPMVPTRGWAFGRAILDRRIIRIDDMEAEPGLDPTLRGITAKSNVTTPIMRGDEVIGAIGMGSREKGGFSDSQVELLKTFAEQAVIAITSAETYRALQTRTSDLQETLEYQTATSDVLNVISRSTFDLQPIFDTIVSTAARLCDADDGIVTIREGDTYKLVTSFAATTEYDAVMKGRLFPVNRGSLTGRTALEGEVVHIPDIACDPEYTQTETLTLQKNRTMLGVPLLREGGVVGTINLGRLKVEPFNERQIDLVRTFAAQAVIAIENTRLITEQREALEQQTATAEVLQVINASPGNLTPVFDAVLEKAMRLCGAAFGSLYTYDGERLHSAAQRGVPPAFAAFRAENPPLMTPGGGPATILETRRPLQVLDLRAHETNRPDWPGVRAMVELGGVRTILTVPLLKDEVFLGYISVFRQEVRAFSDKQIALLENFAAQAVIAMENARLINEQREALEQQTATAEVLQVINASPGNLVPVFDAMLEKAMRLCGGTIGGIFTFDGDHSVTSALRGVTAAFQEYNDKYPMDKIQPGIVPARIIETRGPVQNPDLTAGENYRAGHPYARALVELGGIRAVLAVPLLKDGVAVGMVAMYRQEAGNFSDKEIALLENFAAQAVIAMENARLLTEQREALEQQTATAEVLQVINTNPGDLVPVFEAILEKAHSLCGAAKGALVTFDGQNFRAVATRGLSETYAQILREPRTTRGSLLERLLNGASFVLEDTSTSPLPLPRAAAELEDVRTVLLVPLRRDSTLLGYITTYSQDARAFAEKHITLLQNFAAQAVVAMENARLINEQREALEQQTATAEVLQVINTSPGDLAPVFDAMLDKAIRLCDATWGHFRTYDGEGFPLAAVCGDPSLVELHRQVYAYFVPGPHNPISRFQRGEDLIHISDAAASEAYRGDPGWRELVDTGALRSVLAVALRKDTVLLGYISVYRQEVRAFSDKQIALLENFAVQAVIAMENARLLDEIRQRQAELRTTFDNMGDGVAMFDADLRLAAWNRNFQQIIDLPDALLRERPRYADYMRLLAERGEFGATGIEAELRHRIEDTDQELRLERVRPDGRVIEVRRNAVSGGGFVLIYSDITERKRSEEEIRAARDAAETALRELRTAQANLIQAEKMASLGQLTAGIAHEIKNPLNFVNNFAALSTELIDELRDVLAPEPLGETARTEVDDLTALLKGNLEKVVQHGQRADGIVRSMLDHSRGSSGERRMVDLNALIDEALNLAYHGARAQDQSFNITLERDFGENIARIEVNPQDMTRVFLNLFANGCYAVTRRAREGGDAAFMPTLKVTTIDAGEAVEIRVRDNGTGIPADIRDKLFQPFFTTKPTGEGTGLGLSITYDIVTQQHGGSIAVDSKVGDYSEFMIRLPRKP